LEHVSVGFLGFCLFCLILLSGFFSGSEIGMMSLNRYRLRHLVKKGNRVAIRVSRLLERPDRLLGVILIGNTFANIVASAIATVIAVKYFGDVGIAIATFLLTFVILIFAEVAPKTLAALHPMRFAFSVSLPLTILLKVLYPLVWVANACANGFLRLLRVPTLTGQPEHLSGEELRTVVHEAGTMLPSQHRKMLLSIFDLSKVAVDEIMVPRSEIVGIDLSDDWDDILNQLTTSQHTRLPLYKDSLDNVTGIVHLRQVLNLVAEEALTLEALVEAAESVYFIPEGTPLNTQLMNFQKEKKRSGLVVDEYGDIVGLATLEDILEEIVGEFTTDMATTSKDIHPQVDGTIVVDASITLRELNRALKWDLPTEAANTLSGLAIEYMEMIPPPGTCMSLYGHRLEVMKVEDNVVKTVRFLVYDE
jgi:magnesium and cobalt exporter, CNNM family